MCESICRLLCDSSIQCAWRRIFDSVPCFPHRRAFHDHSLGSIRRTIADFGWRPFDDVLHPAQWHDTSEFSHMALFGHPATTSSCNLFNRVRHSSHCCRAPLADIADSHLSDSRSASSAARRNFSIRNRRFRVGSSSFGIIRSVWPGTPHGPSSQETPPAVALCRPGALSLGQTSSLLLHDCPHLGNSQSEFRSFSF